MASVGATFQAIAEKLGLKNAGKLVRYLKLFPDFDERFKEACATDNLRLEAELLELPFKYDKDTAKLLSDNMKWLLTVRDKEKYSPRIQQDVAVRIDISGAIERGNQRVEEAMRMIEVSNVIPLKAGDSDL